ncbi:hypothetical protein TU79_17950 [Pseudomonas trivialis]|nr:hypothetical protein TU79_17950 [Pseudomonas trivialis]
MMAQQRGPFSSHNALVNPEQVKTAGPGELAELTRKNQALNEKFDALIAKFAPIIKELKQKIANLTQQLESSEKSTQVTPFDNGSQTRSAVGDGQDLMQAEDSTSVQQMPVQASPQMEPTQTPGLEALSNQTRQIHRQITKALQEIGGLLMGLSQQITELFKKIGGTGASRNETPPMSADDDNTTESDTMQPQAPVTRQSEETMAPTQPATSDTRTIETLKSANEQLSTELDQAAEAYEQFIAELQQQVDSLSQQVDQQKQ